MIINDLLDVECHERIALLSVEVAVVEEDLLTADNYILQIKPGLDKGIKLAVKILVHGKKEQRLTFLSQPNRFVVLVGRETQPSSLESRWQREEIECSESHFIYSIHFKKNKKKQPP